MDICRNGEFQMTTTKDKNLFIQNGQLYLAPTLTSDEIGKDAIFSGYTYPLDGCTAAKSNSVRFILYSPESLLHQFLICLLSFRALVV